ncbi:unnamed protein product [Polarella glacialis]|uniref:Uncharacterized protein n=1 Tax=Polarella glacialis TaxID=89957 RepID=A0A813DC68_POLGL|nr:unnamed protein product [Polarella glacialis]
MMAFLQMIGEVIFLSRFEIGVFFLAAGIHFLLFGKHRFDFTVSSKSLKQGHALNEFSKGAPPQQDVYMVEKLMHVFTPRARHSTDAKTDAHAFGAQTPWSGRPGSGHAAESTTPAQLQPVAVTGLQIEHAKLCCRRDCVCPGFALPWLPS